MIFKLYLNAGIKDMQPANLKGGERASQRWSCYDPDREHKEDYENMAMPSAALNAVIEGDLLEEDAGSE